MALRAGGDFARRGQLMRIGKRKAGGAVIEGARGPCGDGMTRGAGRGGSREIRSDVIGHVSAEGLRAGPSRLVAAHAIGGIERVIVVDVALCAGRGGVGASESETRDAVVERCGIPADGGVAVGAVGGRESGAGGGMDGVVGLLPGGEMATGVATISGRNGEGVIVVDVATGARNVGVAVGQKETSGAVIEGSGGPRGRVVALRTVGRGESGTGLGMRRVVGLLPGGEVAASIAAIGGSDLEIVIVVDMATGARNVGVASGQQKACGGVIEFGAEPTVKTVASLAIGGGESGPCAGVRGIGGALPILEMAGITLSGEAVKDPRSQLLVTLVALHGGMSAQEWETVLVVLHLLNGDIPSLDSVTLGAVGAHLAAVNIGVTIGAILAHVGEDGLDVALDALHFFVHATQGVIGLVVIELRNSADGAPTGGGVTVFAGDIERSMRIAGRFLLRIGT